MESLYKSASAFNPFSASAGGEKTVSVFSSVKPQSSVDADYDQSSGIIAKLGILLFALLGFMIALRIGVAILGTFFQKNTETVLIRGMVDATQLKVIPQDPEASGANTITRSVNESDGIEFTWSCWIYIDDLSYNNGRYRCVFYKGNDFEANPHSDAPGLNFPNNAPGVYIAPHTNELVILMNTFSVINEKITIRDVPLNKWVSVIIRCQNTTLDVYINGTITKSHILHGVPKQNYGNVFVGMNGGFSGNISNLSYFNYAIGTDKIARLQIDGANTTMIGGEGGMSLTTPDYLSLRWYF